MSKPCSANEYRESIARVLDGPNLWPRCRHLAILVEKCWEGGVGRVAIVEGIVLEDHEMELRVVHVAGLYAAYGLEAPAELREEVRGKADRGWGETAGKGSGVELAVEDSHQEKPPEIIGSSEH